MVTKRHRPRWRFLLLTVAALTWPEPVEGGTGLTGLEP
jgi:hypothetical protein